MSWRSLFLLLSFVGERDADRREAAAEARRAADAFAGGFPVPPMPSGGAVQGAAAPLVFGVSSPSVTSAEEI